MSKFYCAYNETEYLEVLPTPDGVLVRIATVSAWSVQVELSTKQVSKLLKRARLEDRPYGVADVTITQVMNGGILHVRVDTPAYYVALTQEDFAAFCAELQRYVPVQEEKPMKYKYRCRILSSDTIILKKGRRRVIFKFRCEYTGGSKDVVKLDVAEAEKLHEWLSEPGYKEDVPFADGQMEVSLNWSGEMKLQCRLTVELFVRLSAEDSADFLIALRSIIAQLKGVPR